MKYDLPIARPRSELAVDLESDDPAVIATAITAAALHDADRAYVEALIVKFIGHSDPWVRGVAALAAGHVARIHKQLSSDVVPLVESLLADEQTSGKAQDALDDIQTFAGMTR